MELLEVYDFAMRGIIAKMQEPEANTEELNRKLKAVADLYVKEESKKFLENFNKPIDK